MVLIAQNTRTTPNACKNSGKPYYGNANKNIQAASQPQIEGQKIYSQNILFFKGNEDYDQDLYELSQLSNKARNNPNLRTDPDALNDVLYQELKMLEQEILNPEKYIQRGLRQRVIKEPDPEALERSAIKGLACQYSILNSLEKSFNPNPCVGKLISIITDEKNNYDMETRHNAFGCILNVVSQKLTPENQDKIFKTALNAAFSDSSPKELKQFAQNTLIDFCEYYPENENTINLKETILPRIILDTKTKSKSTAVLLIADFKIKTPASQALIRNTLDDDKPQNVKKALYAMGRVKNEENFSNLSEFLIDIKDQKGFDPLTEMALCAVAQYINTPLKDLAEHILRYFSEEEGLIGEIAQDLLDREKIETEPDFFIRRFISQGKLKPQEVDEYKNNRNKMFEVVGPPISTKDANTIDRAMLPFNGILEDIASQDYKFVKIGENFPVTAVDTDVIGKRDSDGSYFDTSAGIQSSEMVVIKDTKDFAHEFMHKVDEHLIQTDRKMKDRLQQCYDNATKDEETQETTCTDFYAATTSGEYIAQGYDAYTKPTKSLYSMLNNMDYYSFNCGTTSTLERKDPDLYDFIERAIALSEKNKKNKGILSWF